MAFLGALVRAKCNGTISGITIYQVQVSVPSSKPWKETCQCFSVQYCSGRPFKPPPFTLHQLTTSTFHLFHSKRDKKTPNSTKPHCKSMGRISPWEAHDISCRRNVYSRPKHHSLPAPLSCEQLPSVREGLSHWQVMVQTTAAYGGSAQESHSSSKGHNSQCGYTKSKRVQVICDLSSEEHSPRQWALGDMKALGHCRVKHSARLLLIIKKNQNKLTMPWKIDCWLDSKHLPILLPQSLHVCLEQRAELMHFHYAETHCNLISYLAKTSADS